MQKICKKSKQKKKKIEIFFFRGTKKSKFGQVAVTRGQTILPYPLHFRPKSVKNGSLKKKIGEKTVSKKKVDFFFFLVSIFCAL